MHKFLFMLLLLVGMTSGESFAQSKQKKTEYLASNGITYHVGDTIKLGRGSSPKGNFMYVQVGGWASAVTYQAGKGAEQYDLDRNAAGTGAVIKKITSDKKHGVERVILVVGLGNITNYNMYIEDAIGSGEVADSKKKTEAIAAATPAASTADELAKYKKLLDQGAISKAEYEAMKKKLLNL